MTHQLMKAIWKFKFANFLDLLQEFDSNLSMSCRQIFEVRSKGMQFGEIKSQVNIRHVVLDWFRPSCGVIALRPILLYYAVEKL
jgi:hypothetical protein